MSQQIIERATSLARQGNWEQGAQMLRPLVAKSRKWPNAIAALGYCYEVGGQLTTAMYLYAQAISIQTTNKIWINLLERCREKYQQQLNHARESRPAMTLTIWAATLLSFALLSALTVILDPVGEILENVVGFNPDDNILPILIVSAVAGLAGLTLIGMWGYRQAIYLGNMQKVKGEEFADSHHETCWQCQLAYKRSLKGCPFCGAERIKGMIPKTMAPMPDFEPEAPPSTPTVQTQSAVYTIVSDPTGKLSSETPPVYTPIETSIASQTVTPPDAPTTPAPDPYRYREADSPPIDPFEVMKSVPLPPPAEPTWATQIPTEISRMPEPAENEKEDEQEEAVVPGLAETIPYELPPIPAKITAPSIHQKYRKSLKLRSVKLAAAVLGGVVLVSGIIAVCYTLGMQNPAPITKSQGFQRGGDYLSGFDAVNQYITANQARIAGAMSKAATGNYGKTVLDRHMAQACMIRGQLALAARADMDAAIAAAQGAKMFATKMNEVRAQIERLKIDNDFKTAITLDYRLHGAVLLGIDRQIRAWMDSAPGATGVDDFIKQCSGAFMGHNYAQIRDAWLRLTDYSKTERAIKEAVAIGKSVDRPQGIGWEYRASQWSRKQQRRVVKQGREAAGKIARQLADAIEQDTDYRLQAKGMWAVEANVPMQPGVDPNKGVPDDCFPIIAMASTDKVFPLQAVECYMQMLRAVVSSGTLSYQTYAEQLQAGAANSRMMSNANSMKAIDKYVKVAIAHPKECVPRLAEAIPANGWLANAAMAVAAGVNKEEFRRPIIDKAAERFGLVYGGYGANCADENFFAYTHRVWPGLDPAALVESFDKLRPEVYHNEDIVFGADVVRTFTQHNPVHLRRYLRAFPKGRYAALVSDSLRFTDRGLWPTKTWLFDNRRATQGVIQPVGSAAFRPPPQPVSH